MNTKYFVLFVIVFFLVVNVSATFASAVEVKKTPITITKMPPRMSFTMDIIDASTREILLNLTKKSDGAGVFMYTFYSIVGNNLKIVIKYNDNGQEVSKEFGPYPANAAASVEYDSSGETAGTTDDSTSNSSNTSLSDSGSEVVEGTLTGAVTGSGASSSGYLKWIAYIVVAFIAVGAVVFLFLKRQDLAGKFKRTPGMVERRDTPKKEVGAHTPQQNYDAIMAQKKIRELESEVSRLKNKGKIEEIERRMQQEKSEIDRLKRGA